MATSKAKLQFVQLTQALYATQTIDQNTLYFCKDTNRIYLGSTLMSRPAQVVASLPATGIENTVYIRTTDGTIHYYNGSNFVQCYNKKVDDTAVKSVTVSGGTLTTKDFDSNSTSAYINGLVSAVAYNGGKLQITVTENGSTKTVEANVPVDNFLSTVARKPITADDLTGADAAVYAGCEAGDVGVLFTMVNGDKTFVKLTDLVDVYEESNSTSSAVTVSINRYKVSAALKYDNTHFEQDATGALKIKATAVRNLVGIGNNIETSNSTSVVTVKAVKDYAMKKGANSSYGIAQFDGATGQLVDSELLASTGSDYNSPDFPSTGFLATETLVAGRIAAALLVAKGYADDAESNAKSVANTKVTKVTNAVSGNVVKFATNGEVQDSGLATGGATLAATPASTTLATEAAVKAYADGKVAKVTSATENNVVIFGASGEVKDGGFSINTTNDYENSNSASDKILITEKTLSGVVSKLVAGDMGDALNGKLDNVAAGKAGEIITATAAGGVEVSGKKVGGATLAATPDANTVATEAAVADAMSWTIITA